VCLSATRLVLVLVAHGSAPEAERNGVRSLGSRVTGEDLPDSEALASSTMTTNAGDLEIQDGWRKLLARYRHARRDQAIPFLGLVGPESGAKP
jgi:hypothetical protein